LKGEGVAAKELEAVEARVTAEVDQAGAEALASRESNMPPPQSAVEGVYA
jgi:TPP-dependent pyruvate/acetoin dehydrogenase alpha subunit